MIDSELASPVGDKFKTIFSRIPYTKRATPRHRIVLLRRFGKQQECLHNRFSFLKYREKQLAQVAQERHSHSLVPCVQKPSDMCTILVVTDEQLLSASNKSTRASAAAAKPVAAAKAKRNTPVAAANAGPNNAFRAGKITQFFSPTIMNSRVSSPHAHYKDYYQ